MFSIIILLPLLNSVFCGLFGRLIGREGSSLLSGLLLSISAIFSYIAFFNTGLGGHTYYLDLLPWISSGLVNVHWGFTFDSLSTTMLVLVTTVSSLVHIYSIDYMGEDPHLPRFLSYLSLFTFCMLMLVTANNFIQLFFGWEGVGLCSYLLISFWYTRIKATKAALKAMIVNRIADVFFTIGIGAIFFTFHSLDFDTIFPLVPYIATTTINFLNFKVHTITVISMLLFIGAMGKSAQLGLHTWLPDAMEGPTPVSALIHAATMVTAGVFLVIRCSPIFEYSPNTLTFITIIGALTAFVAATIAVTQNDLKKIIAYSTCSQLGYMFFACGLSNYYSSIFHLFNHGFFKALLFLSAGSVIHAMSDEQDLRKLGGLLNIMPVTYICMLIGSLALTGFPFLSGFYSKDMIIETAYATYNIKGYFAYWLGLITALLTSFYSLRLLYLAFWGSNNSSKKVLTNSHESNWLILIPLIILCIGSMFSGYFCRDMFLGAGSDFFRQTIFVLPKHLTIVDAEFIPAFYKLLPLIFATSGLVLAFFVMHFFSIYYSEFWKKQRSLYFFLLKKWYFDTIYNKFITLPLLKTCFSVFFKIIDKGIIELLGPTGLSSRLYIFSKNIKQLQTGFIFTYIYVIIASVIFFWITINII